MNLISPERIEAIAAEHAHHVCEGGSPAAKQHNTKTIAGAITQALVEEETINGCPPEEPTPDHQCEVGEGSTVCAICGA